MMIYKLLVYQEKLFVTEWIFLSPLPGQSVNSGTGLYRTQNRNGGEIMINTQRLEASSVLPKH